MLRLDPWRAPRRCSWAAIAFSGILFRLSHVSPSTGALFRCFWALPVLWPISLWEQRRWGRRPLRARAFAWLAGLFFTADLILWHNRMDEVGAKLATVFGNTQVVLVGLLAWLLFRERLQRSSLVAIPIVIVGVILISGVLEHQGQYRSNPGLGAVYGVLTGLAYTGFLLVLRFGQRGIIGPAGQLFDATLACAVACLVVGAMTSATSTSRRHGRRRDGSFSSRCRRRRWAGSSSPSRCRACRHSSHRSRSRCSRCARCCSRRSSSASRRRGSSCSAPRGSSAGLVIASLGRRQPAETRVDAPSSASSAARTGTWRPTKIGVSRSV